MEIIWIDPIQRPHLDLEDFLTGLKTMTDGTLDWTGGYLRVETDDPHIAALLRRMEVATVSTETPAPAKPRPPFVPVARAEKPCAQCGKPFAPGGPAAKYCPDCKAARAVEKAAEGKPAPDPEPQPDPGNNWRDQVTDVIFSNYNLLWSVAAGKFPVGRRFQHLSHGRTVEVREKPGKEPGEKPALHLVEVSA